VGDFADVLVPRAAAPRLAADLVRVLSAPDAFVLWEDLR